MYVKFAKKKKLVFFDQKIKVLTNNKFLYKKRRTILLVTY